MINQCLLNHLICNAKIIDKCMLCGYLRFLTRMNFNCAPAIRVTCIRTMCLFSFLDTQILLQIREYASALKFVALSMECYGLTVSR
jgi:hypothetical protein